MMQASIQTQAGQRLIETSGVSKYYQSAAGSFTALDNVSLTVCAGEFVIISGRSGSGKSTLANVLTGIDKPSQGEIFIAGQAIHQFSEEQLALWRRANVGIVFQFFQLMPTLTALENIVLAMDFAKCIPANKRSIRARCLLNRVGLDALANKLPAALSGGEQQRVAIARALANDPPLLVADEPTGNLDSKTSSEILGLFCELSAEGKTILMVSHDAQASRVASHELKMADGRVCAYSDEVSLNA